MDKTIYESVRMDDNLPMRILHMSPANPLFANDTSFANHDKNDVHFIPPHWHRSIELTYIVEGGIKLRMGEKVQVFEKGSFFVINSGDVHEVSNIPSDAIDIICLLISYEFVQKLYPSIESIRFNMNTTAETHAELLKIFSDILVLYYEGNSYNFLRIQAKLLEILYLLFEYHQISETIPTIRKHEKTQQVHKSILTYIHEHYNEDLTLDVLAQEFHFSREHFSRIFKDIFGKTFLAYLIEYRLYRAFPEIVNSEHTIETISIKHGFPSSKSLITQFKNKYHETPLQFRKNNHMLIHDHNDETINI